MSIVRHETFDPNPDVGERHEAAASRLHTERLFLRPVLTADYDYLHRLELGTPESVFYRHRGVSVPPEGYSSTLWSGVLVQMVVCEQGSGRPMGLETCFAADQRNGHARLATILDPDYQGLGWPMEASELFVDHLFRTFPFRKLYGDVLEFNEDAAAAARRPLVHVEGRLRAHEFHDGRYWDRVTFAIYREEWEHRGIGGGRAERFMASLP